MNSEILEDLPYQQLERPFDHLSICDGPESTIPKTIEMSKAFIGKPAPEFSNPAVVDGELKTVSLADYEGKYVVLFFYPYDFTPVCLIEITAFSDRAKEFKNCRAQLLAASTDSQFSHLAWINTLREHGGLGETNIPILSDTNHKLARDYGVLKDDEGIAHRGIFIIDPKGILRQITTTDLHVGHSVDESLRLVQAFQLSISLNEWKRNTIPQQFDFHNGLISYVTRNAFSIKTHNKIIQCCKTFFLRNPILTLKFLFCPAGFHAHWHTDGLNGFPQRLYFSLPLQLIRNKIWINDCLSITSEDKFLAASLRSKIYKCDLTELCLSSQHLTFSDFKVLTLSGTITMLRLEKTIIQNGDIIPVEKIIDLIPNLQKFRYIHASNDAGINSITRETSAKLIEMPHLRQLRKFEVYQIPEEFDFEKLISNTKGDMEIDLWYSDSISVLQQNRILQFVDNVIQHWNTADLPPIVAFPNMDGNILTSLRELYCECQENRK